MGEHPLRKHGGRLSDARKLYPDAPEPWIDLSTGINPKPYPAPRATGTERMRLPDPQRLRELESVAARAFGIDDADRVLATAGSEAALRLMPHVLSSATAVIAEPTYSSHADAWRRRGSRVITVPIDASPRPVETAPGSVTTLVNPNNPDGVITPRERLLELHDQVAQHQGFLVVDEAFADIAPECSVADVAGTARYANLIVLRSFGKFYGLAGMRLGFVVAPPAILERLRALLGDWPIAADALSAGLAAYADRAWADRARARLKKTAQRLDHLLIRHGLEIVGGTSLFRLARCADAEPRFDHLLKAGILARPFAHDRTLLRFGLPRGDSAWTRLTTALRSA